MGNVAATFRSARARLKAASTAIRLSSYFTDTTLVKLWITAIIPCLVRAQATSYQ